MKTKYAVIILGVGFCINNIIGALFKIMHWPSANLMFTVGSILEVVGFVLLLYKILTYPKFKEFLNW